MNRRRDYVPTRERNLAERMSKGASLADGLCGRTEVQKRGAHYRRYQNCDGTQTPEKKYDTGADNFFPKGIMW